MTEEEQQESHKRLDEEMVRLIEESATAYEQFIVERAKAMKLPQAAVASAVSKGLMKLAAMYLIRVFGVHTKHWDMAEELMHEKMVEFTKKMYELRGTAEEEGG